jgi:hypothetical protein
MNKANQNLTAAAVVNGRAMAMEIVEACRDYYATDALEPKPRARLTHTQWGSSLQPKCVIAICAVKIFDQPHCQSISNLFYIAIVSTNLVFKKLIVYEKAW